MTLAGYFLALIFFYSLASRRLHCTVITAPIVFTTAGILLCFLAPDLPGREQTSGIFLRIAELGLVLLLFTDASRTDLQVLRRIKSLPARLLSVGMLLTLLLGAVAARIVFPQLSLPEAGILAAILAPTDAGLGQVIVESPRVPLRIREALNVEAGLNDGLSVPFLMFFIGLAGVEERRASLMRVIAEQLGLGVLIGLGIGILGGWLLALARRKEWMAESFQQLGAVALPLLCLVASEATGASMFIAAFVAGLAAQPGIKPDKHTLDFTEECGQLLNLFVFLFFGLLVARAWKSLSFAFALYAALSLTVVRALPVALSLIGAGLSKPTVLFMGWFGPRGLASIVLGLVYLEHEASLPGEGTITLAVMATVLLSIFAHGLSALPGINLYAAKVAALAPGAPEHQGPARSPKPHA